MTGTDVVCVIRLPICPVHCRHRPFQAHYTVPQDRVTCLFNVKHPPNIPTTSLLIKCMCCASLCPGEDFWGAPDLDHTNPHLREALVHWLQHLRDNVGFKGWRFDFAKVRHTSVAVLMAACWAAVIHVLADMYMDG